MHDEIDIFKPKTKEENTIEIVVAIPVKDAAKLYLPTCIDLE